MVSFGASLAGIRSAASKLARWGWSRRAEGLICTGAAALCCSCSPPRPPTPVQSIPVGSGLTYLQYRLNDVPWSIHVLRVDRTASDLEFHCTHAGERAVGLSTLADQAESIDREVGFPVAGINGDFYVFAGQP